MFDKEIAQTIESLTRHVSFLQWSVGISISANFSLIFTVAGLLFKFFRDFKRDAVSKMKEHKADVENDLRETKNMVGNLNDCREENAGNIIRLQEEMKAIIKVCQERHGK